jgi:hypothetical protein
MKRRVIKVRRRSSVEFNNNDKFQLNLGNTHFMKIATMNYKKYPNKKQIDFSGIYSKNADNFRQVNM